MAESPADWRHYDDVHKRRHDFPESSANDDTDGHVQYIAAHRKFFKFLKHSRSPCSLCWTVTRPGALEGAASFAETLTRNRRVRATEEERHRWREAARPM